MRQAGTPSGTTASTAHGERDRLLPADDHPASDYAASDYDALPYVSLPIEYSQPGRIAALAQIYGLSTPSADRARVLELGCGSGGNLIPLAFRYPQARFLGFDLSRRHVEEANARIGALGLDNIEIRQGDLAKLDLADALFDYIICHGVFSWVPPVVQEAILRLCKRHLAANGAATVSYNVLPGWHLRQVVRDMCLLHAGAGSPRARVERARAMIEQIAAGAVATPYAAVVAAEAKSLARMPSSYILGEFLAEYNDPCHFAVFARSAQTQGLRWLCEADLASTLPEGLAPKSAGKIVELAGGDPVRIQSYLDAFTGRTHRRSVLVHAAAHATAREAPCAEYIEGLHFAGRFTPQPAAGPYHFADARGRIVRARGELVAAMLRELGERYPSTVALTNSPTATPQLLSRLRADMLRLVIGGRVTVSTLPLRAGRLPQERPVVWKLARLEAARQQPWVSSLRHAPVILNAQLRHVVQLMDGGNDLAMLAAHWAKLGGGEAAADKVADSSTAIRHAIGYLLDQGLITDE